MFFSLHAWDLFAPQTAHGLPLSSLLEQVLTLVLPFFLSFFLSCCHQIPNLAKVFLIGFYEEREFTLYISALSNELKVPVM
jgi:hypothetical protein